MGLPEASEGAEGFLATLGMTPECLVTSRPGRDGAGLSFEWRRAARRDGFPSPRRSSPSPRWTRLTRWSSSTSRRGPNRACRNPRTLHRDSIKNVAAHSGRNDFILASTITSPKKILTGIRAGSKIRRRLARTRWSVRVHLSKPERGKALSPTVQSQAKILWVTSSTLQALMASGQVHGVQASTGAMRACTDSRVCAREAWQQVSDPMSPRSMPATLPRRAAHARAIGKIGAETRRNFVGFPRRMA